MEDARPLEVVEQTKPPSSSGGVVADCSSIIGAPGGPLFMPGFISPCISVRKFQGSCVTVVMAIQAELDDPSIQCADDADLLVGDLKIVSEEELVSRGLEEFVKSEEKANEEVCAANEEVVCTANEELVCTSNNIEQFSSSSSPMPSSSSLANASTEKLEEKVKEVVACASDNVEQSTSFPGSMLDCNTHANACFRKKKTRAKAVKRGRPFDRNVRAAAWEKGEEALSDESMFATLKRERETARRNCTLQCLSIKDRQRSATVRLDSQKRLQALNFFNAPVKVEMTAAINDMEQVQDFEVILWIEVAKPTTRQKGQHFLVLGSQMLTTLRDKIYCLTDKLMQKTDNFLPSGYFCIENVFYNDMRDPAAIDYSYPILKWMHEQAVKGIYSSAYAHAADMATTSFLDLEFRVGKRYIYCHQGDCKHTLMVRDMRLIHKEDIQNALLYPLLRSPFRVHLRKCAICAIYIATKVTVDDKMAPQSPCCYCDYCYYIQHYSQDGTLLYNDFRVYEYHHE